jgi:O-antigen ligase
MAQLAWNMIEDHPLLGVGVNNVGVRIPDYKGPEFAGHFLYTIHNRYLLAWAEAGIGAAIALVWFLLATLGRAARAARAVDPLVAATGLAIGGAVAAQAVHMSVDIFQSRPQTQGLWLVAGLAAALGVVAGSDERG